MGHRKIAIINQLSVVTTETTRTEGYRDALAKHGIPVREEYVRLALGQADAAKAAIELMRLEDPPTALFIAKDRLSLSVVRALSKEETLSKWPFARLVSSIDEAVSARDAVTIQASKTKETYHMVNERVLSLMADGTHIVNCARGALIDEKSLLNELEKGRLYATLDVYEDEDHPEAIPFRNAPNITLLPHVGGAPSRENMTRAILDAITLFEKGEKTGLEVSHRQFILMTHETL